VVTNAIGKRGSNVSPFVVDFEEMVQSDDFLGCLQCGLCGGSCPLGYAMEFTPRKVILHSRAGRTARVLSNASVWMCVSCYTCSTRCPKGIEIAHSLWPALRDKALQDGFQPPAELHKALQNIYTYGNSLGESPKKRLGWAKALDRPLLDLSKTPRPVDVLWIVECYPSYYPRNQIVARLFAKILNLLGIDWGVLGTRERCLGDCTQLCGEEGLFEMLVEDNTMLLKSYEFQTLLVIDPHALLALRQFYPVYGTSFQAQHYTTYLADRLELLKPMLINKLDAKVTYHDNCCAGRVCKCFEPPRKLLQAIPGIEFVEMDRNRETALCCGGGGGGMWLDSYITEHGGHRLSDERIREAAATGANILTVSCPYELSRFEDSIKTTGLETQIKVRDILELLAESMAINERGQ